MKLIPYFYYMSYAIICLIILKWNFFFHLFNVRSLSLLFTHFVWFYMSIFCCLSVFTYQLVLRQSMTLGHTLSLSLSHKHLHTHIFCIYNRQSVSNNLFIQCLSNIRILKQLIKYANHFSSKKKPQQINQKCIRTE